jgi:enamine deaminase RidA (YjgF/YER057c/UK114 family)
MPEYRLSAPAGYSHVVTTAGPLAFTSGQVAVRADGTIPEGFEAQARLVFEHLGHALGAAGAGWGDVVKLTIFVTDTSELETLRRVRDEFVDTEHPPASSLVRVAGLIRPELKLEVEAVASLPGETSPR